jgi:predicted N-formylglutamate amidohydrolase
MVEESKRRPGRRGSGLPRASRRGGDALLVTCEHGGNRVPASCASRFRGARRLLDSHRGWDPGALQLARQISRRLRAPLVAATISRLVVDLNRSPGHPRLLSERTCALDASARHHLLARHYHPHRAKVLDELTRLQVRGRRVVHVAVHSFTPVLDGVRRRADVGLLYDPRRREEAAFARRWSRALRAADPTLRVLANHPYRGDADGLTTSLRKLHPEVRYLGIELEVNQALLAAGPRRWREVRALLVETLRGVLQG